MNVVYEGAFYFTFYWKAPETTTVYLMQLSVYFDTKGCKNYDTS